MHGNIIYKEETVSVPVRTAIEVERAWSVGLCEENGVGFFSVAWHLL